METPKTECSVNRVIGELLSVSADEYPPLLWRAERLLKSEGPRALAVAMALLDGRYTSTPSDLLSDEKRSRLTGRRGYVCVLLYDPSHKVLRSDADVIRTLKKALPDIPDSSIGRIVESINGYVVDVGYVYGSALTTQSMTAEDVHIGPLKQMPKLFPDKRLRRNNPRRKLPWDKMTLDRATRAKKRSCNEKTSCDSTEG
eukprot:GHVS01000138.1.p1 GENE.GHVS01000138.1~~GHVS01000138.1.p1  ORF type:complete len:200 (-),score=24.31 GHVS01000138.1:116-715(-)